MAAVRVAYLIWSLSRGGAERQLAELVRGLDRARFEPTVIVRRAGGASALTLSTPPRELHVAAGWTAAGFTRLVATLRELRPTILHTYMDPENAWGRIAARLAGVPFTIASVRCPELPRATRLSERLTHPMVRALVTNSVGIRDALRRDAGVPEDKIHVIENGVRGELFAPLQTVARDEERRRWGVTEGRLWVLPGRLSKEKNQQWFLEALREASPVRPLTVVMPGDEGMDPRYAAVVRAMAERANPVRVVVPGVVEDIAALYGAADAVFVPSDYEGLSNAVLEAMSCGATVLVSDGANADGVVRDGRDGLCLGPASVNSLVRAMRRLDALDAKTLAALGAEARSSVTERFGVEAMCTRTMALYDALLAT